MRIRNLIHGGAALLALGTALGAHATEGPREQAVCSRETPEECLNGVSASVTSFDGLRVSGERVSALRRGEEEDAETRAALGLPSRLRGVAAGDGLSGTGVWGGASRSFFESDTAVAPYEADADSFLLGVDRLVGERAAVGIAVGYERTDTDGFSIAPYAAYFINDTFSVDASFGYASLETDQDRIDPANAATLTSSFDADRIFFTANLNAIHVRGPWVLGGRVGILYTEEEQDGYTEAGGPSVRTVRDRQVDLTQVYFGGDLGYSAGAVEPYVLALYRNDVDSDDGAGAGGLPSATGNPQPDDDDEFQFGVGLRYFGRGGVTGSFEWLTTEGREDFDDDTFAVTVRVDF